MRRHLASRRRHDSEKPDGVREAASDSEERVGERTVEIEQDVLQGDAL